ncbi:MAG: GMC family oxidoreductase N-terminal domain-containing protein [Gaiellaceae bacterium]
MHDVVVVGAGAGGPVVAKELAARGLDVLLLEAGPAWTDIEHQWSHDENTANNPATGIFRFGPSDRTQPPWPRDLAQNSFIWQTAGVGGSTVHYFGNSPRAMPDALAGELTYRDLIPYYEWVEHTLPVQTAAMGTKEELFLRAATKAGLPTQSSKDISGPACRPQQNAILQPHGTAGRTSDAKRLVYPRAKGCTFCGHCPQGCFLPLKAPRNLKAKRSTHVSYVPMALTADRWTRGKAATLVADAFAVKIETAGGVARGVTWRNTRTGVLTTEEAKAVVLAAGPIETPRLWLNSGLPNPGDEVGRGLTDHYLDFVVGRFAHYTGSSKGPTSAARADFPGHGSIEQAGVGPGLQAQGLTDSEEPGRRLHGARLARFLSNVDRLMSIAVITDDDVVPENRVTLSSAMTADTHGPVARIELRRRTARTLANRDFLAARAAEILRAAGAREIVRMNWAPVLLHIHSTMRIGPVLTADAESRWVERLFVADNSALPNALGGPNPTLTTQALATRTAERIFIRYFGGEPWVGRESPVSSIDDTVTAAVLTRGL